MLPDANACVRDRGPDPGSVRLFLILILPWPPTIAATEIHRMPPASTQHPQKPTMRRHRQHETTTISSRA